MSLQNCIMFTNADTAGQVVQSCFRHTISFDYARGNQHQRVEHGSCVLCGKKFTRVIRWGRAHELTVELLSEKEGKVSDKYVLGTEPPTEEKCIRIWLYRAEKLAGIEHVKGRGFHGIKRRFATATRGMVGRDKQAGTLEGTLENHYVQDDRDPKKAVAEALAEMVDG